MLKRIVLAAMLMAPATALAEPLELVCQGTALHTEAQSTNAHLYGSDGASASGSATTYGTVRSSEALRLRLDGAGGGKVKLPASLIPPISRGKDGWWDFIRLEVSDDAIRGQFSLNILNKPSLLIDRRTGDIDMKGLGMRFQGACEKAPDPAEGRKF